VKFHPNPSTEATELESIPVLHLQILAAVLFALGLAVAVGRRNLFFVLMGIELMLNAANLSFLSWSRTFTGSASLQGQVAAIYVIAVAASAACVGLAMLLSIFRNRESLDTDDYASMKE
jgi:NADH:ubiquinone oxidoreductase subunit K